MPEPKGDRFLFRMLMVIMFCIIGLELLGIGVMNRVDSLRQDVNYHESELESMRSKVKDLELRVRRLEIKAISRGSVPS